MACLGAIEQLGWPLDRIVHAEVWATDTIPADLPPMVEFKAKADAIIKERWGIEVEHVCAMRDGKRLTYVDLFYHTPDRKCKNGGGTSDFLSFGGLGAQADSRSQRYGWPHQQGAWCTSRLKERGLRMAAHPRGMVQEVQAQLPFPLCAGRGA